MNIDTINIRNKYSRLNMLKFQKDMKKDYYKSFPSINLYREILELISQIRYLESR